MKILIIDDDVIKVSKIKYVIEEFKLTIVELELASTISAGISKLLETKFDIVILDLNIPLRDGETPIRNGGLRILREFKRNELLKRPSYIIGLTGFSDIRDENIDSFETEGWTLLVINDGDFKWEETILNKMEHVFRLNGQNVRDMQKILFLSASPRNEDNLRVDEESKRIRNEFVKSQDRDFFEFITRTAIDFETASFELLSIKPNIVHFSGHGDTTGIALEDRIGNTMLIQKDTLIRLFDLYKETINCIILNACYSENLAQELSSLGIYVVGMNSSISDGAAIAFSVGFYQALGGGENIEFAYKLGLAHISASVQNEVDTPKLWLKGNVVD